MADKETAKRITLPKGRVINSSVFKRDQFNDEAKPSYKIELAFPKDTTLDAFMAELIAAADEKWGATPETDPRGVFNIDGGELISGILDGDNLAKRREEAGKAGDAYKGMWVIRANTQYNRHGAEGEGGIVVYNEAVELIEPVNGDQFYNGCYACAGVTIGTYETEDKVQHKKYRALKCYLVAVQKVADGERLVAQADHSTLFKPVGREAGTAPAAGRRKRAA